MPDITFGEGSVVMDLVVRMDTRVCDAVGDRAYGTFIEILITMLPTILGLFKMCPKKPIPPAPVPAQPFGNEAEKNAWDEAWEMKCRAEDAWNDDELDYNPGQLRRFANGLKREHRRKDDRITRSEALELARSSFDAARMEQMPMLAKAVQEARAAGIF